MNSENPSGELVAAAACLGAGGLLANSQNFGVSTCVRNGAGDYTITHASAAALGSSRRAFIRQAACAIATCLPLTATTTQVFTFDAAAAATNADFDFEVMSRLPTS